MGRSRSFGNAGSCPTSVQERESVSYDSRWLDNGRMVSVRRLAALNCCALIAMQATPAAAAEISGTVQDLCGRVMPGTTVSAAGENRIRTSTFTDALGHYVLGVQPGLSTVTFGMPGFQSHTRDVVIIEPDRAMVLDVRLSMLSGIQMHTTANPTARFQRYAVQGFVRAPDGAVIPKAIVRLRPKRPTNNVVADDDCTTDAEGRYFTIGWSTEPTEWQLSIEADGFRPLSLSDLELSVGEARTVDIRLQRP